MEIAIIGEGEVIIRFIDGHGQTLLQERLVVSGPPGVQALRHVALSIGTVHGPAELAPVVASQSNPKQRVTFDGEDPARFARRRCKAIGCSATVVRAAARGVAPAPTPRGTGVGIGEPAMTAVLRAASGRARRRR
jgi:hypothetical protein